MYVGVYSTVYTCSTYSSKGGGLFSKGQQPASPGRGEGGGGGDRAFLLFVSQLRFFSEHLIRSKYSYILCTLWSAGVLCSTLLYAISLPTYICTTLGRYQDGIPTVLLYCAHHIYVGQSPWRIGVSAELPTLGTSTIYFTTSSCSWKLFASGQLQRDLVMAGPVGDISI